MTTKDFQTKRPLAIFLRYFRPHRRLFALDIICAFMISLVDLAFPLISRTAMYQWLPQQQYRTFFIVMGIVVLAFVLAEWVGAALPWLMSAAAGCMVCVTAQEMIPEAVEPDEVAGVISIVLGFALMMALDVAL